MSMRPHTATTPEVTVPAQNLIFVPLSQLRLSKRNVRKTLGASVTELAATIARIGPLQNLTVILARQDGLEAHAPDNPQSPAPGGPGRPSIG